MTNADEALQMEPLVFDTESVRHHGVCIGIIGTGARASAIDLIKHLESLVDEPILYLDTEVTSSFDELKRIVDGHGKTANGEIIVIDSLGGLIDEHNKRVLSSGFAPIGENAMAELMSQVFAPANHPTPPYKGDKKQKTWQHWQDKKR
jgi:hypothetical protein